MSKFIRLTVDGDNDHPLILNTSFIRSIHRNDALDTIVTLTDGARWSVQENIPDIEAELLRAEG